MATAISLTFTQWSRLRSGDVAGTNAVALDVVFAILRTDVASQHLQTTLCCSISRHSLTSQFRHHGADVDNLAFTTLHHLRQHSAGADVGCHKVNVYHLLKLLTCHFMHRNTFDDASVVHKNVNLTHFLMNSFHQCLHSLLVRHVTEVALHIRDASLLVVVQPQLQRRFAPCVEHDILCTSLSKRLGNIETDAVRCTRHPSVLTFQRKFR